MTMNPMGRNPKMSEAVSPAALKARARDLAPRLANFIEASGQMPAHKGRTYDRTVPVVEFVKKALDRGAVPHTGEGGASSVTALRE
jgi:hypothetical protein